MLYILSPPMSMEALEISMSAQFITTTSVAFVTFTKNSQNHMVVDLNFAFFYINCIKGLIGRRGEKGEEGEGRMGERGGGGGGGEGGGEKLRSFGTIVSWALLQIWKNLLTTKNLITYDY